MTEDELRERTLLLIRQAAAQFQQQIELFNRQVEEAHDEVHRPAIPVRLDVRAALAPAEVLRLCEQDPRSARAQQVGDVGDHLQVLGEAGRVDERAGGMGRSASQDRIDPARAG